MRWAVHESLAQSRHPNLDIAPQPDLGFIYGPLRELFRDHRWSLAGSLARLDVLDARFQRLCSPEEIAWAHRFDTNTDLFDSVTTQSFRDLGASLTENDHYAFENLSPRNLVHEDPNLMLMHREWDRLYRSAQEIIAVDGGLSPLFADLATASFPPTLC